MNRSKKSVPFFYLTLILILLLSACAPGGQENSATEPASAPTQAAGSGASGFIQGTLNMQAPPTPAMTVYALDPATGVWASVETAASDAAGAFTLEVSPGSYQIFTSAGLGYASEDGWSLGTVTVAAGQSIAGIAIRAPGQSECGSMFGIPASPDGRFAAIPGPDEACKAAVLSGSSGGSAQAPMNGALQPLDDDCTNLQVAMEATLQVPFAIEEIAINQSWSGQTGGGCKLTGLANGNNFANVLIPYEGARDLMLEHGWSESISSPCLGYGGEGPNAAQTCFVRGSESCELFVYGEPVNMDLCAGIEGPIGECMDALTPEQILYTTNLICAQGFEGAEVPEESEFDLSSHPIVITFEQGATDTTLHDSLQPGELHSYILSAMAGQEMTVSLYVTIDGVETPAGAVMDIGVRGYAPTALSVLDWSGMLPSTGEYFIDVKSMADLPVAYALHINIAPVEENPVDEMTGAVSGGIEYPGSYVPLLHIVAFNQDNDDWHWVGVKENTYGYTLANLPPGRYHVIAYSENELVGAYASVGDGEPIPVTVNAGEMTQEVNMQVWLERDNPYFPGASDPVAW